MNKVLYTMLMLLPVAVLSRSQKQSLNNIFIPFENEPYENGIFRSRQYHFNE